MVATSTFEFIVALDRTLACLRGFNASDVQKVLSSKNVLLTKMQAQFNVRMGSRLERSLHETIVSFAVQAEKLCPGGFIRTIELLLEKSSGRSCVDIRPTFVEYSRVPTMQNVRSVIDRSSMFGSTWVHPLVDEALRLAGFSGRVIVERTSSSIPSVELTHGCTFKLETAFHIDVSIVHPRIVCIDGYIESVSEVHHLLVAAAEAKEPCIMFVRGLSDEVLQTLRTNYDRGSLKVVPVQVEFDLRGMNTLVDVAVISGGDVVSSLKGDLISNISFERLPCVDQITIIKNCTMINNPSMYQRTKLHAEHVKSKRAATTEEDVASLLDERIRSLTPNHVIVRIPENGDFVMNSQAIDYALRSVRSAMSYGVTENCSLAALEPTSRHFASVCWSSLMGLGAYVP